jgi:ABC-type multidrug transport system fused ATPase/permease subunit
LNISVIKQQGKNYFTVLKWVLSDYHRREAGAFWLVQLLMAVSVVMGLAWLLGIIAGLNQLNDGTYLKELNLAFIETIFAWPMWQWVGLLSLAGMISAAALFASFHLGVQSVIRYQISLVSRLLERINDDQDANWLSVVEDQPRAKIHRILKLSVQLTGLVVRRLSRMLIPLITFVVSFLALIQLDGGLLLNLIPLAVLYVVVLYFINRHAARVQVRLTNIAGPANRSLGVIIEDMLTRNRIYSPQTEDQVRQSEYPAFSALRYQRRLAEVHVVWLNTLFLVLGTAVIVLSFSHYQADGSIDWMSLILFLVALRYAASGLQEMAAATVSFSRFLPETELVHQVLTVMEQPGPPPGEPLHGLVLYFHADAELEVVLPALLKYNFGVKEAVTMADVMSEGGIDRSMLNTDQWIYSVHPVQFKQVVRKNKKLIDHVVVNINGQHQHFRDLAQFLQQFDPVQVLNNRSNMPDDEEDALM